VFIEDRLKGIHHRFKRGYKNVIDESVRLNNEGKESWLAIETSGHAALKENYFLDDGAFLVAKLLVEAAGLKEKALDLSSLIDDLNQPAEDKEIRFKITRDNFAEYGNFVLESLKKAISPIAGWAIVEPNYEGVRVRCTGDDEKGWFLLRLSLHDPVMPLNIESGIPDGVGNIEKRLMTILDGFDGLTV
jgi:phosphomannomutase